MGLMDTLTERTFNTFIKSLYTYYPLQNSVGVEPESFLRLLLTLPLVLAGHNHLFQPRTFTSTEHPQTQLCEQQRREWSEIQYCQSTSYILSVRPSGSRSAGEAPLENALLQKHH